MLELSKPDGAFDKAYKHKCQNCNNSCLFFNKLCYHCKQGICPIINRIYNTLLNIK